MATGASDSLFQPASRRIFAKTRSLTFRAIDRRSISRAGTTWSRTLKNFLSQQCNIFSVLNILKHNPGKENNKFVSSKWFLYDGFKQKTTNRCIRLFGRSLRSAISCQRNLVKEALWFRLKIITSSRLSAAVLFFDIENYVWTIRLIFNAIAFSFGCH